MKTTILFAELLITGIGGVAWIAILIVSLSEIPVSLDVLNNSSHLLLPFLGIAYIIGTLIDRIGYQVFNRWDQRSKGKVFTAANSFPALRVKGKKQVDVKRIRTEINMHCEHLAKEIEYNRSRLRLCRSWILNFFFLFVALLVRFCLAPKTRQELIVYLALFLILSFVSLLVWKTLTRDFYKNLKSSYEVLKRMKVL